MSKDGMNYAPQGKVNKVVKENEFIFSVVRLNHGHIFGMTNGLLEAGATLKYVFDEDEQKVSDFVKKYPNVTVATSLQQVLDDSETKLIAAADIPSNRAYLGIQVMEHKKDYFTDKTPMTTLKQLALVKEKVEQTKQKYYVYFSERLHVEAAVYAGILIEENKIGNVIQVIGLGPHRLNAASRPSWFFRKDEYGGILTDIGSHQIEQFLFYTKNTNAKVVKAQIANYNNPNTPELDDFGDCILVGDNGATNYFRVDWFTPDGLSTWGDGRTIILGTEGYIELRKYTNIATKNTLDHVFLVDKTGEHHFEVNGKVGYPFFGEFILDCINRTEKSMTQEHVFKAAELCITAQNSATKIK